MPFSYRRPILVALTCCVAFLSCSDVHRVEVQSSPTPSTKAIAVGESVKVDLSRALSSAYEKANVETLNEAAVLLAVAKNAATAKTPVRAVQGVMRGVLPPPLPRPPASVPSDIASVMQCIKDHESGNYTESSHPGSGSGAYQYVPGTFRAWFSRWKAAVGTGPTGTQGYTYIDLAYQAPPWIQDAVTVFTLTHGGAGNWSNRFGFDPCTASLPGGG